MNRFAVKHNLQFSSLHSEVVAELHGAQDVAKPSRERTATPSHGHAAQATDWETTLRRYKQSVSSEQSLLNRLLGTRERDPRCLELEEADRRMFIHALRRSYSDRKDTYLWAILVLLTSASILMPFLGPLKGYAFAAFITACWTTLHIVRRM
jgi:hypothetical protein